MTLSFDLFNKTPLVREPFEHLVVPEFVHANALKELNDDYPYISKPGSFPLSEVEVGAKFKAFTEEVDGAEFREAFERKFAIDLANRPSVAEVATRFAIEETSLTFD
jgi:SM-20-related protein